jgi:hypothetical protein
MKVEEVPLQQIWELIRQFQYAKSTSEQEGSRGLDLGKQLNKLFGDKSPIGLVAFLLEYLFRSYGFRYREAIRSICVARDVGALMAIVPSGNRATIFIDQLALPQLSSLNDVALGLFTFATLHELAHLAINVETLWRPVLEYYRRFFYKEPSKLRVFADPNRLSSLILPAIEGTTNALAYTYYLDASPYEGYVKSLSGLPILPAPGVVWFDYVHQDKIASSVPAEGITAILQPYLMFDRGQFECVRDWMAHAVDFEAVDGFFSTCKTARAEPYCWFERTKYIWNSFVLIPTKVEKLVENNEQKTDVKVLRARVIADDEEKFVLIMTAMCHTSKEVAKKYWEKNRPLIVEITVENTLKGASGKTCTTTNVIRRVLCPGGGGDERCEPQEREGRGKEGEEEGGEGECTKRGVRESPLNKLPPLRLPPTSKHIGVGYLPVEELFNVRPIDVEVPMPDVLRRLHGEEARVKWKQR